MFEQLTQLPPDPLLGIIEAFRKDPRENKIDLGVGVYKDDNNLTPVLKAVKTAEDRLVKQQDSKAYLGAMGNLEFSRLMTELALGRGESLSASGRLVALQTPGGCGALRVAAELVQRIKAGATIWLSDPSWANHGPLLGDAGLTLKQYPYYDYENKQVRFEDMLQTLGEAAEGDYVLLHSCCHNPCGADLTEAQWDSVIDIMLERKLIPFVDMAYQGFGENVDKDAYGLRQVAARVQEAIFCVSCSKNFGLYRDRVGLVGIISSQAEHSNRVRSNLVKIVRGIYSMPPDHGAAVVATILGDEGLRKAWEHELDEMRERIQSMREGLASAMAERGFIGVFDYVKEERGMFSFLGITKEQVATLATDFGIYMADSSRINVAGLNKGNLAYFADSLAAVLNAA